MKQKGSYTIEAALLMGVILSVLVAVIYIGFWYHDKSFLQSAAYEVTCVAGLQAENDSWNMSEAAGKLVKMRMLGTRNLQISCSKEEKKASVILQGNFQLPGMITAFFGKDRLTIRESCQMNVEKPSRKIQKVRGALKIVRRAGGDKN